MDTRGGGGGVKFLWLVAVVYEVYSISHLSIKIKLNSLKVGDKIVWLCC